ncbi:MAG: hypothetical protein WA938_03685, partial [Candidatus Dormiibacterota bacterium]
MSGAFGWLPASVTMSWRVTTTRVPLGPGPKVTITASPGMSSPSEEDDPRRVMADVAVTVA